MDIRYDDEAKIFKSVKKTVYVCHGENEFLHKELAKKIVDFLMPAEEQETGLLRFDGNEEGALDRVMEAAMSPSLFAPRQVIYVDNAQSFTLKKIETEDGETRKLTDEEKYSNHAQYERFLRIIRQSKSGVHLVLICNADLKRPSGKTSKSRSERMLQRCYAELDKYGALVHFPRMYDEDLVEWIQDRARRLGVRMKSDEAEQFLEWAGKDVRHLASEIEKLAVYSDYNGGFGSAELRRLVTSSEDMYVFQLVEYMLEGRAKAALRALKRSLEGGADPVYIAVIISNRFRLLWQARYLLDRGYFPNLPEDYKYGGKAVVPPGMARVTDADRSVLTAEKGSSILSKTPFAVYHILKPARRYSRGRIEAAMAGLMDVERRLKGIARPKHGTDEIMVQNFIVDVAKNA